MADDKDNMWVQLGMYGAVGIQLASAVVGGLLIGGWLDHRWGTSPWIAVTGLILGAIGGFYNLFKLLDWYQSRK